VKEIKRQYFTNSYQVQYRDLNGTPFLLNEPGFEILNSTVEDGIRTVTFRLPSSKGPNDLLAAILPYVNVIAFNELIPSMNDIFISTVNAVNGNQIPDA
jgi:ABC-2 type transport system ATP-binding protein